MVAAVARPARLDPAKFRDPNVTARGERRAVVRLAAFKTLWFNTGTLCNLTCAHCYIESSPRNDALVYLSSEEVTEYLDEIAIRQLPIREIGFTGGEPFMNKALGAMLSIALERGFEALVLTNGMKPMMRARPWLATLNAAHPGRLVVRLSLDHYGPALHEQERGPGSFEKAMEGLCWLGQNGFTVHVAGRRGFSDESEPALRAGYARLFAERGIPVDARDPVALMLFPEMDAQADVPEITEACWGILGKSPQSVMCASSRMVVKRKGADHPVVLACTLLAYDSRFELGQTLADADRPIPLNHPHCAKFCLLGGAACSRP
ncbi:MAG: radical SAM protein [Acetobacteraceae bacterium]|nr:radical SAM protein [Acetobacteraceae bacterium]MBV8588611.1 radical SAM protein [Acetobacteraceae bacterium]